MTRILLVDDEKDSVYVFALILRNEGHIVDAYSDPIKALSAFKPGYYDLIILDYRMAGLNGLGFIQKIRTLDKMAKAILITAWEQRSIGSEVQKMVHKGFRKTVIRRKINQ